jgi:hypothetical protein
MPREVTCPSCKHRLRVPADATEKWLTCPRCLASIGNPNVLPAPDAVTASEPPPPEPVAPAEERPAARTCPNCERPVERGWRFCPYCEEELRRPRTAGKAGRLEGDVQRDTTGGIIVASVLGGLLLLGIILFFAMDGPRMLGKDQDAHAGFIMGGSAVVLVMVGATVAALTARNKTVSLVSGLVGGIVFGVGVVFMAFSLFCISFFTCGKGLH